MNEELMNRDDEVKAIDAEMVRQLHEKCPPPDSDEEQAEWVRVASTGVGYITFMLVTTDWSSMQLEPILHTVGIMRIIALMAPTPDHAEWLNDCTMAMNDYDWACQAVERAQYIASGRQN